MKMSFLCSGRLRYTVSNGLICYSAHCLVSHICSGVEINPVAFGFRQNHQSWHISKLAKRALNWGVQHPNLRSRLVFMNHACNYVENLFPEKLLIHFHFLKINYNN